MAPLQARRDNVWFWIIFFGLLSLAAGHAIWATSLDGFTVDEPYHIAAGATYLRWGDYRVNPEHPPLVKLVAALAEPASVLHVAPLEIVHDKFQERGYTQKAVFLDSDYKQVRMRAHTALVLFNTLLLATLTLLLRRIFGPVVALIALLLLALDPTVCAHMKVVMTDLPMALLGAISCCMVVLTLRDGRWREWLGLGVAMGLLLASKHSAPVIALLLLALCAGTLAWRGYKGEPRGSMLRQVARLGAAVVLSFVVLWATYGFHYYESRVLDAQGHRVETFNRPLTQKISDLRSPRLRWAPTTTETLHVVPRAYLWGLADTLRAGVEGRPTWLNVFGRFYSGKGPWWTPFGLLMVKLPIGYLLLTLGGIVLFALRRVPTEHARPLALFLGMALVFLIFIGKNGVFYAGVRHWLFTIPLLAIAAAVCVDVSLRNGRLWVRGLPAIALLLIAVDVLPQKRPWEYHNALGGGTKNAWRYFNNESVDLGQRGDEIIDFAKAHVSPEEPLINYWMLPQQMKAEKLKEWQPTPEQVGDGYVTGWLLIGAQGLPVHDWYGMPALRNAQPVERRGNVLIYHGRFYLPKYASRVMSNEAHRLLDGKENADKAKAEKHYERSVQLNPEATSSLVEMGNFAAERGEREKALDWYQRAWKSADDDANVQADIMRQMNLLRASAAGKIPAMRNPHSE